MRLRQRSKKAPSETLVSLEQSIEGLLAHVDFLESENEKLRRVVTTKEPSDALADHEQVILRLQQVIRSKETAMDELQNAFRQQREELEHVKKAGPHSPTTERLRSQLMELLEKIDRLEKLIFAPQENRG